MEDWMKDEFGLEEAVLNYLANMLPSDTTPQLTYEVEALCRVLQPILEKLHRETLLTEEEKNQEL